MIMNPVSMLTTVRQKKIKPKIYAIFLASSACRGLYLQIDYSLEDAIGAAKHKMADKFGLKAEDIAIEATTYLTVEDVSDHVFETEIKEIREEIPAAERRLPIEQQSISDLMGQIIHDGDVALYKKNKKQFKLVEQKYIEEKLNIH